MEWILTLFKLAGSLGLFLYGMKTMSNGLQVAAGDKMKKILKFMTGNRLIAVITGALITLLIQSSTATTVMLVSFVNAGLMSLDQAVGVILGANIGTTITVWLIALLGFKIDITVLALISVAISLPLMLSKKPKRKTLSEIFLGFGILFIGLRYLQTSIPDLSGRMGILSFLANLNSDGIGTLLLCVLIGFVLTQLVNASSAAMAITLTMAYEGWIGPYAACAMCLGQNIGTTVTAYLASVGGNTASRRAGMAHVLFNVIGAVLTLVIFNPMLRIVAFFTGCDVFALSGEELNAVLPTFLAGFHTAFNVFGTIVFFPFVKQFCRLIERLVPQKAEYKEDTYHFTFAGGAGAVVETPEIFIMAIRDEMKKMSELTAGMFDTFYDAFRNGIDDTGEAEKVMRHKEEYADQMQEQLTAACVKLLQDAQAPSDAKELTSMIRIMDELESITDSILDLMISGLRAYKNRREVAEKAIGTLAGLAAQAGEFIHFIDDRMEDKISLSEMQSAMAMETRMNDTRTAITAGVEEALAGGNQDDVALQLHILEQARHMEHLGDYCINIAESSFHLIKHAPVLEKR